MSINRAFKKVITIFSVLFTGQFLYAPGTVVDNLVAPLLPVREYSLEKSIIQQWFDAKSPEIIDPELKRFVGDSGDRFRLAIVNAQSRTFPFGQEPLTLQQIQDFRQSLSGRETLSDDLLRLLARESAQGTFSLAPIVAGLEYTGPVDDADALNGFFTGPKQIELRSSVQPLLPEVLREKLLSCSFVKSGNVCCLQLNFVAGENYRLSSFEGWEPLLKLACTKELLRSWISRIVKHEFFKQFSSSDIIRLIANYNDLSKGFEPLFQHINQLAREVNQAKDLHGAKNAEIVSIVAEINNPANRSQRPALMARKAILEQELARLKASYGQQKALYEAARNSLEAEKPGLLQMHEQLQKFVSMDFKSSMTTVNSPSYNLVREVVGAMQSSGIAFQQDSEGAIIYDAQGLPSPIASSPTAPVSFRSGVANFSYGLVNKKHIDAYRTFLQGITAEALRAAYWPIHKSGLTGPKQPIYDDSQIYQMLVSAVQTQELVPGTSFGKDDPRALALLLTLARSLDQAGFNFAPDGRFLPFKNFAAKSRPLDERLGRVNDGNHGLGSICSGCESDCDNEIKFKEAAHFASTLATVGELAIQYTFDNCRISKPSDESDESIKSVYRRLEELKARKRAISSVSSENIGQLESIIKDAASQNLKPECFVCYLRDLSRYQAMSDEQRAGEFKDKFFVVFEKLDEGKPCYNLISMAQMYDFNGARLTFSVNELGKIYKNPLYMLRVNPLLALAMGISSGDFTSNFSACKGDHLEWMFNFRSRFRATVACGAQTVSVERKVTTESVVCGVLREDGSIDFVPEDLDTVEQVEFTPPVVQVPDADDVLNQSLANGSGVDLGFYDGEAPDGGLGGGGQGGAGGRPGGKDFGSSTSSSSGGSTPRGPRPRSPRPDATVAGGGQGGAAGQVGADKLSSSIGSIASSVSRRSGAGAVAAGSSDPMHYDEIMEGTQAAAEGVGPAQVIPRLALPAADEEGLGGTVPARTGRSPRVSGELGGTVPATGRAARPVYESPRGGGAEIPATRIAPVAPRVGIASLPGGVATMLDPAIGRIRETAEPPQAAGSISGSGPLIDGGLPGVFSSPAGGGVPAPTSVTDAVPLSQPLAPSFVGSNPHRVIRNNFGSSLTASAPAIIRTTDDGPRLSSSQGPIGGSPIPGLPMPQPVSPSRVVPRRDASSGPGSPVTIGNLSGRSEYLDPAMSVNSGGFGPHQVGSPRPAVADTFAGSRSPRETRLAARARRGSRSSGLRQQSPSSVASSRPAAVVRSLSPVRRTQGSSFVVPGGSLSSVVFPGAP